MILKNRRIFVIEDDMSNRIVLEMLMREHGAETSFDRWGRRTLKKLQNFQPVDLILLDLMFANGITGYDIFELIRSEDDLKNVPVVAVSASDPTEAISRTREMGFAGFIPKPIRFDVFPQQVADILAGEEMWLAR